jgi:hypothetical protein
MDGRQREPLLTVIARARAAKGWLSIKLASERSSRKPCAAALPPAENVITTANSDEATSSKTARAHGDWV